MQTAAVGSARILDPSTAQNELEKGRERARGRAQRDRPQWNAHGGQVRGGGDGTKEFVSGAQAGETTGKLKGGVASLTVCTVSEDTQEVVGRRMEQSWLVIVPRGGEGGEAREFEVDERSMQQDGAESRTPVSQKWPTMLVWSGSDSGGGWRRERTTVLVWTPGACVWYQGAFFWEGKAGAGLGGSVVRKRVEGLCCSGEVRAPSTTDPQGSGDSFQPGTSVLFWQEEVGMSGGYPGRQCTASWRWDEEKAGPRAGSWMASPEDWITLNRAKSAPQDRCDGRGCAPTDVTFPWSSILACQEVTGVCWQPLQLRQ
ncbi:hypothetical protein NDU88_001041 [Pleurodeles waltl]|uniref:Uncharacterized protein n=1 Tax=Pleurodeles waltl TaxID=8319 RepID=A0AAV7MIL9_PLEWA|nr:hypothetical protein NDU88_001041 [Pleurodeles waltl]